MSSDYYTPAARLARVHAEKASAGWSWESDSRRRLAVIREVLSVKGRTCHLCGLPGATTADHLIPRGQGGGHTLANLEPAHAGCNMRRKDLTMDEWNAKHPRRTRPALAPSRDW